MTLIMITHNAGKNVLHFLQIFHNYFHFNILAKFKSQHSDKNCIILFNLYSPFGLFIRYNGNILY